MEFKYFKNIGEFHHYLDSNHQSDEGIWIKLDKRKIKEKLTANQALEEALCYGWIDGQLKSLGDDFYLKYFCKRRAKSPWSERNKNLVEKLIKTNRMKPSGFEAIASAKKDGRWNNQDEFPAEFSISNFIKLLNDCPIAKENYLKMPPSIQKTYALSYYSLKKEDSRQRRLITIHQRLKDNLKPM